MKKQKAARPLATKKPAPTPKETQLGGEVQQDNNEVLTKIFEELKDTKAEGTSQLEPSSPPAQLAHPFPSRAEPSEASGGTSTLPPAMVVTLTS
ncbi:hypothetical protein ACFX14_019461 [Malus domestica]